MGTRDRFVDEHEVRTLLERWGPIQIVDSWCREIMALGIDPAALIQDVHVRDPAWAGKRVVWPTWDGALVAWWPKGEVEQRRLKIQAIVDGPLGLRDGDVSDDTKGPRHTIEYLLGARGDAMRTCAVLMSASFFPRLESSRGSYPRRQWPPSSVATEILDWMRDIKDCRWSASCTDTLPWHDNVPGLIIEDVAQLIRFIAAEHARVFHGWTPVHISFVTDP